MTVRYRKRPVEVEAIQYVGFNKREVADFAGDETWFALTSDGQVRVYDVLHDSWINVNRGDWVIRGVKGEIYPCAADVFAETYELVREAR